MSDGETSAEIVYARVCLRSGTLLEILDGAESSPKLVDAASAAPELFRADAALHLGPIFTRLGSVGKHEAFQEIVLISTTGAQAVQRLASEPEVALLALCQDSGKLGLLLSGLRERVLQREAPP
ncbi:MAG TPA: hypothetical protein VFZ61_09180 [Polyangiales bacterium]